MTTCRFGGCTAPATQRASWTPFRRTEGRRTKAPVAWCSEHKALLGSLAKPGNPKRSIAVGDPAKKIAAEDARLPRTERLAMVVAWARSAGRPITRAEAATASGLAESAMSPVLRLGVENGSLRRERGRYVATEPVAAAA